MVKRSDRCTNRHSLCGTTGLMPDLPLTVPRRYVLANIIIFAPAAIQSRHEIKLLAAPEPGSADMAKGGFTAEVGEGAAFAAASQTSKFKRPTVRDNAEYFLWADIKKK